MEKEVREVNELLEQEVLEEGEQNGVTVKGGCAIFC
jgi:hypothetical protein